MNPSWGVLSSRWQRIKLVFSQQAKEGDTLDSVVPGEVTEVQLRAKCASNPAAGHWSRWSEPVRAMVPQSSGGERGEENICNPAAGHGALHRRDGLNVSGLLLRWYFTDVLHLWPAQHHLHVEHHQIRARQWRHTFLQDESGVHYLSLQLFLNGTINPRPH